MAIGDTYNTGNTSSANAYYEWVRYVDGTTTPRPTAEEKKIRLKRGEVFSPINSCDKGAIWRMTSYA
ncbi:YjzC family protein [Halanaerobaculum tunisiense]